ncbi:hypothetical protein [Stenotrophomonas oahuensis]|uniref:Uncharacterized protein n=1 Tax=Stenotrophomonas oahuensis TaxID=3003271 RepID=A0ABY9YNF3_9GAMM|nr:hypothetical protein [Stenotrophomonas sp. A5586]WNH52155.1 hypothetical protein PDM29_17725 [Stenotrophomonas sp. A5586]
MALTPFMAAAAEPATFVLQASGFEDGIVANEQGRLVQDWPGKPQLLVPGRWVAVDFESQRSVWFDDAAGIGRALRIRNATVGARARPANGCLIRTAAYAFNYCRMRCVRPVLLQAVRIT